MALGGCVGRESRCGCGVEQALVVGDEGGQRGAGLQGGAEVDGVQAPNRYGSRRPWKAPLITRCFASGRYLRRGDGEPECVGNFEQAARDQVGSVLPE